MYVILITLICTMPAECRSAKQFCSNLLVAFNVLHIIDTLFNMQEALLNSLPKLVASLSSSTEG